MSDLKRRRVFRNKPERSDTASVRFDSKDFPALILDISEFGCCLALVGTVHELELQQALEIQISAIGRTRGEIRWMAKIDESLFKIGMEFSS